MFRSSLARWDPVTPLHHVCLRLPAPEVLQVVAPRVAARHVHVCQMGVSRGFVTQQESILKMLHVAPNLIPYAATYARVPLGQQLCAAAVLREQRPISAFRRHRMYGIAQSNLDDTVDLHIRSVASTGSHLCTILNFPEPEDSRGQFFKRLAASRGGAQSPGLL